MAVDLSTEYLGLKLRSPLVASSSPLCERLDSLKALADTGLGCIVLHSLFEEQINTESHQVDTWLDFGSESFAEALSFFPDLNTYNLGPDGYLDFLAKAKKAVDIPIIGSLNGVSQGGWTRYAKKIEEAGADALELNIFHLTTNPDHTCKDVEARYLELISAVTALVQIPVTIKLGDAFSALPNMIRRIAQAGAKGVVLFNRFYQPDFDLEKLEVVPNLVLSTSSELRSRLRWTSILHSTVPLDIAVTGGVHTHEDVLKTMMAGAKIAMMASALLKHGIGHAKQVLDDLRTWMEVHEYTSINQMQGSMSQDALRDPKALARANYLRILSSYSGRNR
ncbi:MAG: dihydroorotate dehydrogenase [Deltaproteobacteria bacterium CG2_30_63_29]|nr:MAG: dihydroorotate dehydrogenase [Deltaproteobacteria bacterium CG2_30_63_29]PIW02105.1 MAG: dihydroorotate dehydrogenase [Deltaproteobacteria bacterium CG17_big_fil_post_rev_8_21_14_2_50_63_7]